MRTHETDYDVVLVGGAFAGAASAILLKRWMPKLRVLIVERAEAFDQKVGEATVEVSAHFLHRVLGLYDELSRVHLPKHGLRYWFTDSNARTLAEMSECGADEVPRLPAFQLDRAKLDERLLALAKEAGAEVVRPARVTALHLAWPVNRVRFERGQEGREVTCRWVIDASGRSTLLARQLGLHRRNDEHPVAASWGRWSNVRDMDGASLLGLDARKPGLPPLGAARRLATNHFSGYGYWCWAIPLGGGETSVGVVYNKELFDFPAEGSALEKYRHFVLHHPGLKELLNGATLHEADFKRYSHLPYTTTAYAGRGWALVGDAASFIDPYYSPGLDHVSMSVFATVRMLEEDFAKNVSVEALDARIANHNEEFTRSYDRWFRALYLGKYELMGDAELTVTAFLLDTAFYYLGVFAPIHKDVANFEKPVFGLALPQANAAYACMRFYSERLVGLARARRRKGIYGRRNLGWNVHLGNVGLGWSAVAKLMKGLGYWGRLEVEGAWSTLRPDREPAPEPYAPKGGRRATAGNGVKVLTTDRTLGAEP